MAAIPAKIYRGDTWQREWRLTDNTGAVIDLTGASARLHLRDGAGAKLIDATSANGKLVITPIEGKVNMTIAASETDGLAPGSFKFDLEIAYADGTVQTYDSNVLIVLADQTNEAA